MYKKPKFRKLGKNKIQKYIHSDDLFYNLSKDHQALEKEFCLLQYKQIFSQKKKKQPNFLFNFWYKILFVYVTQIALSLYEHKKKLNLKCENDKHSNDVICLETDNKEDEDNDIEMTDNNNTDSLILSYFSFITDLQIIPPQDTLEHFFPKQCIKFKVLRGVLLSKTTFDNYIF